MTIFYSDVEPLSKYSPVTSHFSPATRILNENPDHIHWNIHDTFYLLILKIKKLGITLLPPPHPHPQKKGGNGEMFLRTVMFFYYLANQYY